MTACATEPTADATGSTVRRAGFTIAADGSYAACLAQASGGGNWFPERWTLDSTEPYTVPLPGNQPEEPSSEVLPLPDGRVLIRRRVAYRHDLALLYPTGPGTGEVWLGSLDGGIDDVRLLPPSASGDALARSYDAQADVTAVWLVHGGSQLRRLAMVSGRCTGGVWLDDTGRMLALDREADGRTKAVAVDLEHGDVSPLLQITDDSNDRLLLADPDSGLLVLRSDAPGEDRLGWGILGSRLPVRFPEALRVPDAVLTPFAAQPGQMLAPDACAVALRADGPQGTCIAVWRPGGRRALWLTGPDGWLPGTGMWTARGVLRLPYACPHCPCGVVSYEASAVPPVEPAAPAQEPPAQGAPAQEAPAQEPPHNRVLPLQQAPLGGG
ncbi:MAG: hypothetical protein QOI83_2121 [Streptomycetaceae bacterium]|nr:hypothetical protein [Streptomycetaceae bacterium]